MSQTHTGRGQLSRLLRASLRVRLAPELIDVDTVADAQEVAREAPDSRFAATMLGISAQRELAVPHVPDNLAVMEHTTPLAGAGSAGR
jgi:hypothetical protein